MRLRSRPMPGSAAGLFATQAFPAILLFSFLCPDAGAGTSNPNDFSPSPGALWHDSFCTTGNEAVLVGDFNGDGRDDLVAFEGTHVWVMLSRPGANAFDNPMDWNAHPLPPGATPRAGDLDGDGRDDLVYFMCDQGGGQEHGDAIAVFSTGNGFGPRIKLLELFSHNGAIPLLADVNDDTRADLIAFHPYVPGQTGTVYVGLSRGRGEIQRVEPWTEGFLGPGQIPLTGDFDGDGKADIAAVVRGADPIADGDVHVALSGGNSFGTKTRWHDYFCVGAEVPFAGDVDGDRRADMISFVRGRPDASRGAGDPAGDVYVALSNPQARAFGLGHLRHAYFCVGNEVPLVGDFNGDGKADICTLVRNTLASSSRLHGDVRVALSTFGKVTAWKAVVDTLRVDRAEDSGGDEPYLVVFGYRVRANDPDSAQVWVNPFRQVDWPKDMTDGESVRLPPEKCSMPLDNMEALTRSDFVAGRMPEMLGVIIVAIENDATSWQEVEQAAEKARNTIKGGLVSKTRSHPVRPASWPADLKTWMVEIGNSFGIGAISCNFVSPTGLTDHDDYIGAFQFHYPTLDPELFRALEMPPPYWDFGTRTITAQKWTLDRNPIGLVHFQHGSWFDHAGPAPASYSIGFEIKRIELP